MAMSGMPSNPAKGHRSSSARRLLAWTSCVVAIAFVAADGVPGDMPSALAELASLLVVLVGALLVTRVGTNPVSWLLWLAGLLLAVSLGTGGLANFGCAHLGPVPVVRWLAWVSAVTSTPPLFLMAGLLPLAFPTGRLLSRRWRIVAALAVGAGTLQLLAAVLGVGATDTYPPGIESPILATGQLGNVVSALNGVTQNLNGVLMVLGIAALAVRFRRATHVERQQLKWFTYAAGLTIGALLVAVALNGPAAAASSPVDNAAWAATFIGVAFLPVAIGVAILRYRLYAIDRIISRTVGWAIVTGLLVTVFAAAVGALDAVLAGLAQGQTLAVAASTLIAFAAFQPIRRRVQRAVDRRFDRSRYDAARVVSAFVDQLRDETDLVRLSDRIRGISVEVVRPACSAVWLRDATNRPTHVSS
jgi:hypothetical protein